MPGKSVMVTSLSRVYLPSFFSTVTPGQLPTYWLAPVSSLNIVVLPQFGLPARAMQMPMFDLSCDERLRPRRTRLPEALFPLGIGNNCYPRSIADLS